MREYALMLHVLARQISLGLFLVSAPDPGIYDLQ